MIEIGTYNHLTILRQTGVGLFLGDNDGEEVLLPAKYCPENFNAGDSIHVFVYQDHEERKVATNIQPKILLKEFAFLKVNAVNSVGAFLDWGLEKDLLVPFSEQRQRMEVNRWYVVFMDIDYKTNRLFATNKIEKKLHNEILYVKEGDNVDLLVYHKTELGYGVIINNTHKGLVYKNEIFRQLNIGDNLKGYVKKIRADNKIDISLRPLGYKHYNDPNSEVVFQNLIESDGYLPFNDKSAPGEIYTQFGMSKKEFKKAIGTLYKNHKITIETDGIKLI